MLRGQIAELGARAQERKNSKTPFAATNLSTLPACRDPRSRPGAAKVKRLGQAVTACGAQRAELAPHPCPRRGASRPRPEPEQQGWADDGEQARAVGPRHSDRERSAGGYSPRRGGERAGAAEGDALTNPSRSSKPRKLSPPVWTPTIRRRPPQRGQ